MQNPGLQHDPSFCSLARRLNKTLLASIFLGARGTKYDRQLDLVQRSAIEVFRPRMSVNFRNGLCDGGLARPVRQVDGRRGDVPGPEFYLVQNSFSGTSLAVTMLRLGPRYAAEIVEGGCFVYESCPSAIYRPE